jgi:hypothetical protein
MSQKRRQHKQQSRQESQPSVDGDKKRNPHGNHQNIPANQECKRAVIEAMMAYPSAQDKEWQDAQKRQWETQNRLSKWFNWISIIVGIIAIGSLVAVYWQAKTSEIAAQATVDQVSIMDATFKVNERSWVTVQHFYLCISGELQHDGKTPCGTGPNHFRIEFANFGHTPSIDTTGTICVDLWTELPEIIPECKGRSSHMVMSPGGSLFMTKTDPRSAMEGNKRTAGVYGIINYVDIFGLKHWSKFCFLSHDAAIMTMKGCERGNEIGDTK